MNEFWKAAVQIGFWKTVWLRIGYRPWSRLLHRFDLHYAPRVGPNRNLAWCHWCGLRSQIRNLPPDEKL